MRKLFVLRFYLAGLLTLGVGFLLGLLVGHYELPPYVQLRSAYRWARSLNAKPPVRPHDGFSMSPDPTANGLTDAQQKEMERLRSVGYLSGVLPAGPTSGVTIHDKARTSPGINLLSIGHRPEARLMTMEGETIHSWSRSFFDSFPGTNEAFKTVEGVSHWRRVHLLPNGELLAIHDGVGLVKLSVDSELLWSRRNGAHHDLEVAEDGRLYVLTRQPEIVPWYDKEHVILHDFIEILDPGGNQLRKISLMEAIRNSPYKTLLRKVVTRQDPLHTNDIELLDGRFAGRLPAFKKGNVLVSFLSVGSAVVDLEREQVTWVLSGYCDRQHHPTILDSGNLLIFDNDGDDGRSRVLEIDLVKQQITWIYDNSIGFLQTDTCGANQRLPNNNTLITETDRGRAIEVAPSGETVWEYISPERAGANNEYIARLFEVKRYSQVPGWLTDRLQPTVTSHRPAQEESPEDARLTH